MAELTEEEKESQRKYINEIKSIINDKTNFTQGETLFQKPVSVLDSFSPELSVKIKIPYLSDPLKENVLNNSLETTEFDMFAIPYNNVKSFEYSVSGENANKFTLVFTDTEYYVAETILTKLRLLDANGIIPELEINYGWNATEDKQMRFEDVIFQRNLSFIGNKYDYKYTESGVEITIEGSLEQNLPEHLRYLRPYNLFGVAPLYIVAMTEFCQQDFIKAYEKIITIKEKSEKLHQIKKGFVKFYYKINNNPNLTSILKTVKNKLKNNNDTIYQELLSEFSAKDDAVNTITDAQVINEEIDNEDKKQTFESIEISSKEYYKIITGVISYAKRDKDVSLFAREMSIFFGEFYLHPYKVFKFFYESLIGQLSSMKRKNSGSDRELYNLFRFDFFDEKSIVGIENLNLERGVADKGLVFSTGEKDAEDKWDFIGIQPKEIILTKKIAWKDLFNMLGSQIRVKVPEDTTLLESKELNDKTQEELKSRYNALRKENGDKYPKNIAINKTETDGVLKDDGKYYNFSTLKCNFFTTESNGAKSNLKVLKKMKNRRDEISNSNSNIRGIFAPDSSNENKEAFEEMLNKMSESLDNNKYKYYGFLILSERASNSVFNPLAGKQKLVNTYTYRHGENEEFRFNAYKQTPNKIRFPDIISLETELDFFNQVSQALYLENGQPENFDGNLKIESLKKKVERLKILKERKEGGQKLNKEEDSEELKELVEKYTKKDEDGKKKDFDPKYEQKKAEKELIAAQNELDFKKDIRENLPVKIPITYQTTSSTSNFISKGRTKSRLANTKKQMENMRKRFALSKNVAKVDIQIMGDASYTLDINADSYVYLKVLNHDGTESLFSSFYSIMGVKQSISAGTFTTTLSLRQTISNDKLRKQLYQELLDDKLVSSKCKDIEKDEETK